MFRPDSFTIVALIAALLIPLKAASADTLQFKCQGSLADLRYTKIEIGQKTYYTDKFGSVSVPSAAALTGQSVAVYPYGTERKVARVPTGTNPTVRQILVPCGS